MAVERCQRKPFNSEIYPDTCLLLYVDDDVVNQQVLDMLLSTKSEYRVLLACDQQEVEDVLRDEACLPDVVFMDNQLVDCTGVQVIAWMRRRYSEDLVFVMCTALSQLEATKLAAVARAEGYLCKPYTMKDLLDLLSNLRSTWHSCALGSVPVVGAVALADSKARAQSQNDLRTAQGKASGKAGSDFGDVPGPVPTDARSRLDQSDAVHRAYKRLPTTGDSASASTGLNSATRSLATWLLSPKLPATQAVPRTRCVTEECQQDHLANVMHKKASASWPLSVASNYCLPSPTGGQSCALASSAYRDGCALAPGNVYPRGCSSASVAHRQPWLVGYASAQLPPYGSSLRPAMGGGAHDGPRSWHSESGPSRPGGPPDITSGFNDNLEAFARLTSRDNCSKTNSLSEPTVHVRWPGAQAAGAAAANSGAQPSGSASGAGPSQRVFITAACVPGTLAAADTIPPPGSASVHRSGASTDAGGSQASGALQDDDCISCVRPPFIPEPQELPGRSTYRNVDARVPVAGWGPVWVRLSPQKDGNGGIEYTVVLGEVGAGAEETADTAEKLRAACAATQEVLEAELSTLSIAPGELEAAEIACAVQHVINVLSMPAACTDEGAGSVLLAEADDHLCLDDLLQVLGATNARKAVHNKGLTLSELKCMSAMEVMQQGVVVFPELEAVMDALHSL